MNYSDIKRCDVANGTGVRVTLFVSGCKQHCPGCFNEETWDFNFGKKFDEDAKNTIFKELEFDYIDGVTLLGGDPLDNEMDILPLVKEIKEKYPQKTIWIFSGQTYETIIKDEVKKEILDNCDILVDGRFVQNQYRLGLVFRGSSNQRIIDLNRTRENNDEIVLWRDGEYGDRDGNYTIQ